MELPQLYRDILSNDAVQEILAGPFDFEVVTPGQNISEHQVLCSAELTILAREGAGGIFALFGDADVETRPVIFVSSEGQAGKIADNFNEAIELIVTFPYWSDLLKFSGGGKIDEMRKSQIYLQRELAEDEPDIDKIQKNILGLLNIKTTADPVLKLNQAVKSKLEKEIKGMDGSDFESLFNTFVVENNPMWTKADPR